MVVAPPPVDVPAFRFDDGAQTVQTTADPAGAYRSFVEFNLRSRWNRPADIADKNYVAEIEVAVSTDGRVSDARWKRKSGNARWDASVLDAVDNTRSLGRPPPQGFPPKVTIRFDVVAAGGSSIP